MNAVDASSSPSSSSSEAPEQFAAAQLPVETPAGDIGETAQQLRQCSVGTLRRAREDHRRALESLRQGGYGSLPDSTRDRLMDRLRRNLKALNRALDEMSSTSDASDSSGDDASFSSRVRALCRALWEREGC